MSDVYAMWQGPKFEPLSPNDMMTDALNQPMSFLDTLGAQFKGGVLNSPLLGTDIRAFSVPEGAPTIHLRGEREESFQARRDAANPITEDQYKNSPYYREGIPFDARMTDDRAAALAEWYDAKKVREYFASKRPYTSFVAGLAGQAVDPINYVPIAGPLVKGAAVARLGRIGGEVASASLDAMSNVALSDAATYQARRSLGDEITWQSTVSDIAMGGLIGAAFGGLHGTVDMFREGRIAANLADRQKAITEQLSTLENTQSARVALNDAIDSLARGENVNLSPNSVEPIVRIADELNPVYRPYTLGKLDRADLFSTTALSHIMGDQRPALVQDFEEGVRNRVFQTNPELGQRFQDAQQKFKQAQDQVTALETPLAQRRQSDTAALIDQPSAERLRAIEDELAGTVKANRRKALEAERDSIVETLGPDNLAKAENDFRIGPEKKIKAARKVLTSARQEFSKVQTKANQAAQTLTKLNASTYQPRIDTSVARADPPPAGLDRAAKSVGKPEATKDLAEQYGVKIEKAKQPVSTAPKEVTDTQKEDVAPTETASYLEQSDIDQVRAEGRLTAEDEQALTDADKTFEIGAAFGEALKAAVACVI